MKEEMVITSSSGGELGFVYDRLEVLGEDISEIISEMYLNLINEIWHMKKGTKSIPELREKYEVKLASMLNDIDNAVGELSDFNGRIYSDARSILFKRLNDLENEE